MSKNIPSVARYLVNYWRAGKVIRSAKVLAPTMFLAKLAANDENVFGGHWRLDYDRRTISRMRKVPADNYPVCPHGKRIYPTGRCMCMGRR